MSGSGKAVREDPIRKCAGVSAAKSFGSSVIGSNGRLFMIASICVKTVHISSKDNREDPN